MHERRQAGDAGGDADVVDEAGALPGGSERHRAHVAAQGAALRDAVDDPLEAHELGDRLLERRQQSDPQLAHRAHAVALASSPSRSRLTLVPNTSARFSCSDR